MNLFQKIAGVFMAVISTIGEFFSINLTQGETLYNQLTPAEQQAAQWGSGVVHVFNSLAADFKAGKVTISQVLDVVYKNFPTLDKDLLHGFLDSVNGNFNVGLNAVTLEDAAEATLNLLAKNETGVWAIISKAAATLLTLAFSPESIVQKIEGALEYVYHLVIKPNVQLQVASAVDTAAGVINEVAPGSEAAHVGSDVQTAVDEPADPGLQPSNVPDTVNDPDMQISKDAVAELSGENETPTEETADTAPEATEEAPALEVSNTSAVLTTPPAMSFDEAQAAEGQQ